MGILSELMLPEAGLPGQDDLSQRGWAVSFINKDTVSLFPGDAVIVNSTAEGGQLEVLKYVGTGIPYGFVLLEPKKSEILPDEIGSLLTGGTIYLESGDVFNAGVELTLNATFKIIEPVDVGPNSLVCISREVSTSAGQIVKVDLSILSASKVQIIV